MFLINDDHIDKTAVVCDDGSLITYKELKKLVEDFGNNFENRSLVFLLGSNNLASLVCYLSCLEYDLVPLLLSENINDAQLSNLIDVYSPKYIFSKRILDNDSYSLQASFDKSSLFLNDKVRKANLHNDLALLSTTSGSTGSSKLVKLTKKNIQSNAESISDYLEISCEDRAITSLPINYSYGMSIINSHLVSGGSIILSSLSMMEENFWRSINDFSATSLAGVPFHYEMMLRLGIDNLNIPTIKKMTQAGGKLNYKKALKLNNSLQMKGIDFYIMYGQTEATSRMTYLPYRFIKKKIGSIGVPIPNGEISLDNKDSEIIYKGKNVSLGYAFNCKDLAKGDVNNKILKTGDLARKDKDGFLYIIGRKLRETKIYGHRINLDELEILFKNNGIKCACLSLNNKIIIFHNQKIITKIWKSILDSTTLNLNYFKTHYLKKIPINENNKTSYKKLEKLI